MKIEICPYKTENAEIILEIINHNILNSTALYDYNIRTIEEQKTILADKIKKGFPVIVAKVDNKTVGFGYYSEFRFREAYKFTVEHSVYVHPDYQSNGIGKMLLSELISLAKTQKLHTMIAVIDSENIGSMKFHEQFGFETVGFLKETGFKFDRWLNSVFMQLMV
jgi:L-amino acid N-acyltransferase